MGIRKPEPDPKVDLEKKVLRAVEMRNSWITQADLATIFGHKEGSQVRKWARFHYKGELRRQKHTRQRVYPYEWALDIDSGGVPDITSRFVDSDFEWKVLPLNETYLDEGQKDVADDDTSAELNDAPSEPIKTIEPAESGSDRSTPAVTGGGGDDLAKAALALIKPLLTNLPVQQQEALDQVKAIAATQKSLVEEMEAQRRWRQLDRLLATMVLLAVLTAAVLYRFDIAL